jgi:serine/threonine protein kinase
MEGSYTEPRRRVREPSSTNIPVPQATREAGVPDIAAGTTLDRYLLLHTLSESRSAIIYMGHDMHLDRSIALKCPPAVADTTVSAARLREAQALARMRSPHVVTLHTTLDTPLGPVLVLEHLVGQSLARQLQVNGKLRPQEAQDIFEQALAGLEAVHRAGVIHGNLKPDNLFVTTDHTVKLLDFRLAGFNDKHAPGRDLRLGDLLYGAPEQVNGYDPDIRSDLYSLGLCLYEALTGHLPFSEGHSVKQRAQLSAGLSAVVEKAIRQAPEERYQSAREFRQALSTVRPRAWRWRRDTATGEAKAKPAPASAPAPRHRPGRRWVRSLTVDAALLVTLLGLVWALGLHAFKPPASAAQAQVQAPAKEKLRRPDMRHAQPHESPGDKYQDLRQAWGG